MLKLYANKISYDNEDEIINSSNQIDAFAKLCGLQTENPTSLKKRQFTINEEISQNNALRLENNKNVSDFWRSQQKIANTCIGCSKVLHYTCIFRSK